MEKRKKLPYKNRTSWFQRRHVCMHTNTPVSQRPTGWDRAWITWASHNHQHLHGEQWVAQETAHLLMIFRLYLKMLLCGWRLSSRQVCMYVRMYDACLPHREAVDNMYYSHLCWISRPSFLFLVWSAGEGEFKFLAGGATSAMVSLEPSWSEVPRSVFLHLALRFWNHTWGRRTIQAEYPV